jgi:hypothetical protein
VDRRFAWLGAAFGALAVWHWRRRKHTADEDPADALRAKLEESRSASAEVTSAPVDDDDPDLDARRRSVHEDARARIDELRGGE